MHGYGMRSHMVRHVPRTISLTTSSKHVESEAVSAQRGRDGSCMRLPLVRHVPQPLGDRLSVRQHLSQHVLGSICLSGQ